MPTDTKTVTEEAVDTAKQFAEVQEQAVRQWNNAQEQAIGALREAQTTFQGSLPTPAEVIEAGYGYATQALELQKSIALRWAEWWTPRPQETERSTARKNG